LNDPSVFRTSPALVNVPSPPSSPPRNSQVAPARFTTIAPPVRIASGLPARSNTAAPAFSSVRPSRVGGVGLAGTDRPPSATVRPAPDMVPAFHVVSPVTVTTPAPVSVPLRRTFRLPNVDSPATASVVPAGAVNPPPSDTVTSPATSSAPRAVNTPPVSTSSAPTDESSNRVSVPADTRRAAADVRLRAAASVVPSCVTTMPAVPMTASSAASGTRPRSQFPGVSQSPPAGLTHVMTAGMVRSSRAST
jgi:hypothetical protein